eukprot:g72673.t1
MDDTKGGVWKIRDLTCKSGAYQYVQDHWKSECMEMINTLACAPEQLKPSSVWRMEFAHVKPIRDSDWAKDGICTLLADECQQLKRHKEDGFENQAAVEEYKRRSQLHHKIHRTNRTASVQRKAGAPGDQTCTTISTDMTHLFSSQLAAELPLSSEESL